MPRDHRMFRLSAMLLAVLGLSGMLGRAVVPAAVASTSTGSASLALIAALGGSLCHGDDGTSIPGAPAGQHAPDCALCPACVFAASVAAIPAQPRVPPLVPVSVAWRWAELAPVRAPPLILILAAPPRGPPALS